MRLPFLCGANVGTLMIGRAAADQGNALTVDGGSLYAGADKDRDRNPLKVFYTRFGLGRSAVYQGEVNEPAK